MKEITTKRILMFVVQVCSICCFSANANNQSDYSGLTEFFQEWREFESPPIYKGAPDYTQATFDKRYKTFQQLREKLLAFDKKNWSLEQQIDWQVVLAELNGFDFNYRILKPWVRDPAFYKSIWDYKSDVPAHEGPSHHSLTEWWTYSFPLSESEQTRLIADLSVISPLIEQAKLNLTGNAKELWIAGIRDIREQRAALDSISDKTSSLANDDLNRTIVLAKNATDDFIIWLENEAKSKTGPSGIGKENYSWYQQNVHLLPMSWEDEVQLLKRELDRAWSSLKLEEHRNRNLPQLIPAKNQAEFEQLAERSAKFFLDFLERQNIVTVADYFEPALREHLGEFVPIENRHFFYIGSHLDPTPLYSHFYHWFELARMDNEPHPSPIRRGALLYNIFDTRNEGTATAVEEIFMHAGLYDHNPRVREIVWIMLAQRAARGLGSLYAHANIMTMEQAGQIHMDKTPRGWMKTEPELLLFEQHLYLRQPGYGTSYVTGKYMLESTMADYAKLMEDTGKPFELKQFFDQLNGIGNIPISLGRWQMTGTKQLNSDQLEGLVD